MGLDLILENRNKAVYGNDDWHELAYGRKTWVIADFFRDRNEAIDGDWLYNVSRESWDQFIAAVTPYATDAAFLTAFNCCDKAEWGDHSYKPTDEDYAQLKALIKHMSADSDYWVQLGDLWEVDAILRWYNENPAVQEAFNREDEIRLVVSY